MNESITELVTQILLFIESLEKQLRELKSAFRGLEEIVCANVPK